MEEKLSDEAIVVRRARIEDLDAIYSLGINEPGFQVSETARFYSREFIEKWIRNSGDDLLLVAEVQSRMVGFLFCRVTKDRWAMAENIAVIPDMRRSGIGKALAEKCFELLKQRGTKYVAALLRIDNDASLKFSRELGFIEGYHFIWMERYLDVE